MSSVDEAFDWTPPPLPKERRGIPFRGTGCIHFVVRSAGGILVVFSLFPC
jgi:hypothetical protein